MANDQNATRTGDLFMKIIQMVLIFIYCKCIQRSSVSNWLPLETKLIDILKFYRCS